MATRSFAPVWILPAALAISAQTLPAQQPQISNGRVSAQSVTALHTSFRAAVASLTDIGWVGYAVPIVDGERMMCCSSGGTWVRGSIVMSDGACCGTCGIEPSVAGTGGGARPQSVQPGPIKLEGGDLVVLYRVVGGQVDRVRVFSESCALDAGGRPVIWLTNVKPPESVAVLESLVTAPPDRSDRVIDGGITAIALHRDGAADAALDRLLATTQPQSVRAKVPFWLGNSRGRRGLEMLQRVVKSDPASEVRKKAVFGLSQSREPDAVDILVDNARNHPDAVVRGESLFWLAQKAGTKAAATIASRIDEDPDTEVKKRAVFALSQLPKDEGVPLLIRVARTHTNPAVRKQAFFWLGQSKDPRALELFAEILK